MEYGFSRLLKSLRVVCLLLTRPDSILVSSLYTDNMGYDSNEAGTHGITLNRLQHNGGGSPLRDVPSSGTAAEYDAASQVELKFQCFVFHHIS